MYVAASIALSGIEFGGFLSPIIIEQILRIFTWNTVFLLLGSQMALLSTLTLLFRHTKPRPGENQTDKSEKVKPVLIDTSVFKSPPLIIMYISAVILHFLGDFC